MSIRQEIHDLVDQLGDTEAEETLDYIRWLLTSEDTLTPEELEMVKEGEEQLSRGESISLEDFRRSLSR